MLDKDATDYRLSFAETGTSIQDLHDETSRDQKLQKIRVTKRVTDLCLLILSAPFAIALLSLCAIAIRVDTRGPVFFRQKRFGMDGREFTVTKFRTMKVDQLDYSGGQQTQKGDMRVTAVGRFLRRTCLDELPQMWDILRGDMSFVGPRPHPVGMRIDGVLMENIYSDYHARLRLPPGLTGLSQVNGNRGPVHDYEYGKARLDYDKAYIENWSLWQDLKIIAITPVLPFKKGCY
ncbi:MAG: sugar transferase [Roseobacter sp.]